MSARRLKRKSPGMTDEEVHRRRAGAASSTTSVPHQQTTNHDYREEDDFESRELLLIDYAIKQNSYSAFLLHSEEHSNKAIQILSDALSSMKRIVLLARRDNCAGTSSIQPKIEDEATQELVMTDRTGKAIELFPNTSFPLNGLQDSKYFIYNYTMNVSDCHHARTFKHPAVFTSGILLNLALAHHRLGVNGDHASFSKAENLYSMGLQLIGVAPPDTPRTTVYSVMIIAVNNLAHVHYSLGHYQKARALISQLSSLLHVVQTAHSPSSFFSQRDLHRFTMNAMLWCTPKTAGAA